MSATQLHSVSVAGVTFDETHRVLLIKRRDNGQWQAPGGVLELGETFEQGVEREVLEESGVHVAVERLTGVYKNMSRGVVALVYRCNALSGAPAISAESVDVAWFDIDDALRRMVPAFAVRVQDAAANALDGPASRAHNGIDLL